MLDSLMLTDTQRSTLEEATRRYEAEVDQAASYLLARGIGQAAATGHHLGYVADPMPGHERFEGMLAIPYVAHSGPVAIKFRRIDGSPGPKYDGPSAKARLYNARACVEGGPVVLVCEGELDAVAGSHLGVPCVATPGTQWQDHWGRMLADFDRVLVVADHDQKVKDDGATYSPGLKHADKVRRALQGAEVVTPPPGMDLSDWLLADGLDVVGAAMGL